MKNLIFCYTKADHTVSDIIKGAVDITSYGKDGIVNAMMDELAKAGSYSDNINHNIIIEPTKTKDIRFGYEWDYGYYQVKQQRFNDTLGTSWYETVALVNFGPDDIVQPGANY